MQPLRGLPYAPFFACGRFAVLPTPSFLHSAASRPSSRHLFCKRPLRGLVHTLFCMQALRGLAYASFLHSAASRPSSRHIFRKRRFTVFFTPPFSHTAVSKPCSRPLFCMRPLPRPCSSPLFLQEGSRLSCEKKQQYRVSLSLSLSLSHCF